MERGIILVSRSLSISLIRNLYHKKFRGFNFVASRSHAFKFISWGPGGLEIFWILLNEMSE